jgi:hypothetical protein
MSAETTTTTLTEMIRNASWNASQLYFAERPGVTGFVTIKDITGEDTLVARFPIYDKVSALAISEASDFTTNSALDTTGSKDATVSEHAIRFEITDLSLGATVEDVMSPSNQVSSKAISEGGVAGQAAAEALQRLQDQDVCALFGAFDSSTGSNSGPLTQTLLINAITQLNLDNIPTDRRVAVLHAKQWQAHRVSRSWRPARWARSTARSSSKRTTSERRPCRPAPCMPVRSCTRQRSASASRARCP